MLRSLGVFQRGIQFHRARNRTIPGKRLGTIDGDGAADIEARYRSACGETIEVIQTRVALENAAERARGQPSQVEILAAQQRGGLYAAGHGNSISRVPE